MDWGELAWQCAMVLEKEEARLRRKKHPPITNVILNDFPLGCKCQVAHKEVIKLIFL